MKIPYLEVVLRLGWIFILAGVCLTRCASSPSNPSVLEPVEEVKYKQGEPPPSPSPVENSAIQLPTENPNYGKLRDLLATRGIEGVGLQFESNEALDFIFAVLSDQRVTNRKIKNIYTGKVMAYDPKHQSLTVGGPRQIPQAVQFILKNIPATVPAKAPR